MKIKVDAEQLQAAGEWGPDARNQRGCERGSGRPAAVCETSASRAALTVATFPISLVRRDTPLTFAKSCAPATFQKSTATRSARSRITNTSFEDANVVITDQLPEQLRLVSVSGGTQIDSRNLLFNGVLDGASRPMCRSRRASSPAGYLPLALFGVPPIGGMGDDTIINFNVPAFSYAGETWTSVGVGSNGYVVVGGGTGAGRQRQQSELPESDASQQCSGGVLDRPESSSCGRRAHRRR